ncbi:MAG: ribosome recycling factor, partial [Chthoniobacterales bacterium]
VDGLDVEAYGSSMKLKQVALITVPEPRMIIIQPFDATTTRDIERAIHDSRLGINPVVDGKIIRIPIPELSEERRRDLVKTVKGIGEETRVRVRSCRRDAMESVKKAQKAGDISEDQMRTAEDEIQKLTDQFNKKVEDQFAAKEAEIMKV